MAVNLSELSLMSVKYCRSQGYRFTSVPLVVQEASSSLDCAALCSYLATCHAYDWLSSTKSCRLFKGENAKTLDTGYNTYSFCCGKDEYVPC